MLCRTLQKKVFPLMDVDLPKSVVKRLVKATLDRLDQGGADGKSLQLNKVWIDPARSPRHTVCDLCHA